jgi:N-acetylglucosaminyl-diphospho-decaprenol L-rhamnosyltransferase
MRVTAIDVVAVNYYSNALLRQLESLIKDANGLSLIVVDNSGDFIPSSEKTICITPACNIGFGSACNLGMKLATAEILLFLNPDTRISLEDIYRLAMLAPKKVEAIWGPVIRDDRGRASTLRTPGRYGLEYRRVYLDLAALERTSPIELSYISGACMMVRTQYLKALGGFSSDIFLYGEDLELCTRARERGASILLIPDIHVEHRGGRSSGRLRTRFMRLVRSYRGHYRFLAGRMPKFAAMVNALHLASGLRI